MALAPLTYTIWNRIMRFDPQDPIWPNRDRFVLSNGHASIASGSEVILAIEAHEKLSTEGIRSRVVSMPSREIFDEQKRDYRESVLPSHIAARISLEQASIFGWERYVGKSGRMIGMKTFGASAPLKELQKKFGFAPDRVVVLAKQLLGKP